MILNASPGDEKQANQDDEEPIGRWDHVVNVLLPATRSLRRALPIDEQTFRLYTFRADPRAFVLWTVIDELEKVAMCLMRLDGFLDTAARDANPKIDAVERTSLDFVLEEIRLRARRLTEVITLIVLFGQKDETAYYFHFLLLESYVEGKWFDEELDEFHGKRSAWIGRSMERLLDEIRAVENGIDRRFAWYAKYKGTFSTKNWKGAMTSQRERFKMALPLMTDFERMALGGAYHEAFSQPSDAVHFSPGVGQAQPNGVEAVEADRLGLIAFSVANRCFELLGQPQGDALAQIHRLVITNTEGPRHLDLLNVRSNINVGDFVAARGHLGEVSEIAQSEYGYRSFRVLFLEDPPMPDLSDDWFRAREVFLFTRREKMERRVAAIVGKRSDAGLCRESVRQAWKLRQELVRQGAVPTPLEDESPAAKVDAQEANADAQDEKNHAGD